MKKRITAILLALTFIISALGGPAGLAEARYTASTSLEDASNRQIKNMRLAADAIDGVEVEYGETFSFNEIVGPRTGSEGYVSAENGRGVKVTGGGVSQVATTLYLALLRLGDRVEFTRLTTYGSRFEDTYVSDGNKAVITDYSGGTDFAFVNRAGEMTIEMWASNSALNCVVTIDDEDDGYTDDEGEWFVDWDDTPAGRGTIAVSIPTYEDEEDTRQNVELAARSVNGTQLESGDVFSFNEIVGPRTKKYGYGPGTNGRGAVVTGGGVAQVASAIWLAVKQMDDVSVIEKSTYGKRYNQEYVDSSADAIVTDYKEKKDFSFRYNGDDDITIYTYVSGNRLHCEIAYD